MREYSSALAGFQQIINQNPYNYEGLIARWDYMATSLLLHQGTGGGESSVFIDAESVVSNDVYQFYIRDVESVPRTDKSEYGKQYKYAESVPRTDKSEFDKLFDDRSPYSRQQRTDIYRSVKTALEITGNDDESRMKILEQRTERGDKQARKELEQRKTLQQVIKPVKPGNITEHIKIVSEDVRRVFGSNTVTKTGNTNNIPSVFRLSQNYPNPFNPVTKISYDLPVASRVKLVIYDILGREVKQLINNELKTAGSYIVEFSGENYASGVYFYRMEAEEQNGSKYIDSKKMVLVK